MTDGHPILHAFVSQTDETRGYLFFKAVLFAFLIFMLCGCSLLKSVQVKGTREVHKTIDSSVEYEYCPASTSSISDSGLRLVSVRSTSICDRSRHYSNP